MRGTTGSCWRKVLCLGGCSATCCGESRRYPCPEDSGQLPPKGMFVRERSPRGEVSGQWPRNKDLRTVPRRRGLS